MAEPTDESVADRFDDLMGRLDGPMVVVTTASGGQRAGCLVGFHAQCGMDPPGYAIWLSKANRTYRIGALADVFALHFLGEDDRDLAELFGGQAGDELDKFARCDWTPGINDVPLLVGCADRIVGRRRAWLDAGTDHVCVILDPVDVTGSGPRRWLGLSQVDDIEPGHLATERQRPR